MSVLARKSWKDVRRRWARSFFTVATIAVAVAGLSLFGVMPLLDRAATQRVTEDRLNDIELHVDDATIAEADFEALRGLPGVEGVDARTTYRTRIRDGDRRIDTLLVGVANFQSQPVDAVGLANGTFPLGFEALDESQNARSGRFDGNAGKVVQVEDNANSLHPVTISGEGSTLQYSQVVADSMAVLYLPQASVNTISGSEGVNTISIRANNDVDLDALAAEARTWFSETRPDVEFLDVPVVRPDGSWPGQDIATNFSALFYVGGLLALLSAVVLVSNTMTTMVAEQRKEIAIMKAIGGRRRQILGSFLRTVLMLSVAGTGAGILLGIPLSNLMAGMVGSQSLGIDPDWGISFPVLVVSAFAGVGISVMAALPALLHAARLTVAEGLHSGLNATDGSRIERLLRKARLPRITQVGLRNITRRKSRTAGTIVQVGLAVGVTLGFLGLGTTVSNETVRNWDIQNWDMFIKQRSNVPFDAEADRIIESTKGFESGHPVLLSSVEINGTQFEAWAVPPDTRLFEPAIRTGRWFETGDSGQNVAVVGPGLAAEAGLEAGDTATFITAGGPAEFTIIGVDGRIVNSGRSLFVPLDAFQAILGREEANGYWLVSASKTHADIDRLAANVEDSLSAGGYPASVEIHYVERDANLAAFQSLLIALAVMSVPIVAIGLIGLLNMMTMNVIERTREIGMLRCIGAGSGQIKRIFRTEALAVAFLGWLVAVPLGWIIGWLLVRLVSELFNFGSIPYSFPLWYPPIALVITLGLAWLVVIAPVRRATHLRPGEALRFE